MSIKCAVSGDTSKTALYTSSIILGQATRLSSHLHRMAEPPILSIRYYSYFEGHYII